MKIGLVSEGSYPYVSGGVAGWVHMVINHMRQHEFEIISIMPELKTEEDYKYDLPENVSGVTNIVIGEQPEKEFSCARLTKVEIQLIKEWLQFQRIDEKTVGLLGRKMGDLDRFFTSRVFWSYVTESYQLENQSGAFLDYFWVWQSMYSLAITLLQNDVPDVDLVHAVSTGYAGLFASCIKQNRQIPYVLTEHGIYAREREEEILQSNWIPSLYKKRWIHFFQHLARQAYNDSDDVITLFERNSRYQEEIGAAPGKLRIIPNGIDYEKYSVLKKEQRKPLLVIGAIVRIVPIKDIKTMIYAAEILEEGNLPFELWILGPDEENEQYARECREMIERFGLEERVFITGKIEVADYLPKFDVCILTSISEGQPLAALEAMAAGIPVILTDVGACREMVHGGQNDKFGDAGFVIPPVSPEKLAETCEWFYENPREGVVMGTRGKKRVDAHYRLDYVIERYVEIYRKRGLAYGRDRV